MEIVSYVYRHNRIENLILLTSLMQCCSQTDLVGADPNKPLLMVSWGDFVESCKAICRQKS